MVLQNNAFGKAYGLPETTLALNKKINEKTYEIIMKNDSKEIADKELKDYFKTTTFYKDLTDEELDKEVKNLYSEYFRQLLLFDPQDYLPKINCLVIK